MNEKAKVRNKLSQVQFIVIGFFAIITLGTILLMLPVSSRDGCTTSFLQALFTAVSSTCVTGLVVVDTYTHWSVFGQIIILLLIQVGGLGFITIGVMFSLILRRRIGLKTRGLLQESVNTFQLGGIIKLAKKIVFGTLLFEGAGAIILSIRFCFDMGPKGIYYGIFHSISAFCNAGFDLMGCYGEYSSLSTYVADPVVNIVIMTLIVVGGIGFLVWDDVHTNGLKFKKYKFHTKIVLITTAILIFGSAILFYLVEYNNTMKGMGVGERILASLFSSITARTAGFNTVDTGALSGGSKILTIILMFIGGSPGSTAGGIKTTTVFVLFVNLWFNISKGSKGGIFKRRFEDDTVKKASTVLILNLILGLLAVFLLLCVNDLPFEDVMFEVFSAIGTVGMSAGITRDLNVFSKVVLIILMFCGRIGSLSFALSFLQRKKVAPVTYPKGKISIG